jgi:hypothetical protein
MHLQREARRNPPAPLAHAGHGLDAPGRHEFAVATVSVTARKPVGWVSRSDPVPTG